MSLIRQRHFDLSHRWMIRNKGVEIIQTLGKEKDRFIMCRKIDLGSPGSPDVGKGVEVVVQRIGKRGTNQMSALDDDRDLGRGRTNRLEVSNVDEVAIEETNRGKWRERVVTIAPLREFFATPLNPDSSSQVVTQNDIKTGHEHFAEIVPQRPKPRFLEI